MVARTDIPFMMHTIPHLVKACSFPFEKRVLVVDGAPLRGDKVSRPGIGTMEQLRASCDELIHQGVMDYIIDMDYSDTYRNQTYRKYFSSTSLKPTHNYKGYPILGSIFSMEEVPGDYVLHFDSDMMLYQSPDYNWIEAGIELLTNNDSVMFVRPLSCPPGKAGEFYQKFSFTKDPGGFYRFKFFGSRAYLLNHKKFDQLLPLPVLWTKFKRPWISKLPGRLLTHLHNLTGRGALDSWEVMVSRKLEKTQYVRATLTSDQAWTVHPKDRGERFINALPGLIRRIEAGEYPDAQGGYYDLKLDAWLN